MLFESPFHRFLSTPNPVARWRSPRAARIAAIALVGAVATGCASTPPYDGGLETNKQKLKDLDAQIHAIETSLAASTPTS